MNHIDGCYCYMLKSFNKNSVCGPCMDFDCECLVIDTEE